MLVGSGFLLLIWIVLWIAGFVDALTSDPDRIRVMPKAVWVILILLFSGFAAIAWFVFGRPRAGVPPGSGPSARPRFGATFGGPRPDKGKDTTGWQLGGTGGPRRAGPVAPDDDPEFLRRLGKRRPDDSPPGPSS